MPPDDRHLLTAAAHGDPAAMDALIHRHAPLVLTACRRQLPAADADDATQAVFLILWRRTFAAAAAPGLPGWLVVTARQVCANARRAAQRRHLAERAMPPPQPAPPNEARALLDEALASLPASEREAVIRRHLLGEDPLTVATALNCAEGTIHSRTSRGLARLRTWFARHGIATTATGLLALCSAECSAAQLAATEALVSALRNPPTPTAQHLAASSTPSVLATLGVPLMSVAALALAAAITWSQFTAVGDPSPQMAPPTQYTKVYDVSDLYDQSVMLVRPSYPHAVNPRDAQEPPPVADPAIVASLDACRRLDELTTRIQAATGGQTVRFIDGAMSDEDLRYGQPAGTPDPVPWLRESLASTSLCGMPGATQSRSMLVVGDRPSQARLDAYLHALRDLRHARLGEQIQTLGVRLTEATKTLYGADWYVREERLVPHPPLITVIPAQAGHACTVIWLPEGADQRYSGKPLAVASDGTCSLLVMQFGVIWQPEIRSAAIALYLRRKLDSGKLHAPLLTEDWLDAASAVRLLPWRDDGAKPLADLTELIEHTAAPAANF